MKTIEADAEGETGAEVEGALEKLKLQRGLAPGVGAQAANAGALERGAR